MRKEQDKDLPELFAWHVQPGALLLVFLARFEIAMHTCRKLTES
jgi:hypothetical protein